MITYNSAVLWPSLKLFRNNKLFITIANIPCHMSKPNVNYSFHHHVKLRDVFFFIINKSIDTIGAELSGHESKPAFV